MGYVSHKAILVTVWNNDVLNHILRYAYESFGDRVVGPHFGINDYKTFVILPTGSKEGWEPAEKDIEEKENFLTYLKSFNYEDGSSPIHWVYVMYGDEGAEILKTNTENRF